MQKTLLLLSLITLPTALLAQSITSDASAQPQRVTQLTLTKPDGALMLATNDIITNISRSPELASFYKEIQNAGLEETFKSQGLITLFAPANKAFNTLSSGKRDTLKRADHKYELIALVTYHAVPGIVTAKEISRAIAANNGIATFTTLTGNKLTARLNADRNIVLVDENGRESIISKFDISQSNGLIHIIDAVLVPKFKTI